MDNNGRRAAQVQVQILDQVNDGVVFNDWRTQLQLDSRHRIVNKIVETLILKKHLPFSEPEALHEVKIIAHRVEEKIYSAATSLQDYSRKVSLKLLQIHHSNDPSNSINPPDQGR